MKKQLFIFLVFLCPVLVFSQSVEVNGNLKVSDMDTINTEDHLVVKRPDGTLATRMVASLPPPIDTSRNLASDLELAKILCQCNNNMPPFLVQSTLDAGYSIADLFDAGVPVLDLLAGGVSIADLLAAGVSIADLLAAGVSIADLLAAGVSIADLLAAGASIADLLDAGQTPKQIYDSDNTLLDSLYGKTYQGGLIAYLDTITGTGLIAAPVDQSTGVDWGCYGIMIGGTSSAIGTGQANTTLIVNGCAESGIAARLCDDLVYEGYDDWFLPSKDELDKLYENLKLNGFGGFSSDFYWSSTEFGFLDAWTQYFNVGVQDPTNKEDFNGFVRAVRAF